MKRWYFPLRRVEQGDNHGCGIACVATVCGITYERARSEFFPRRSKFRDDESLHVAPSQMMHVIQQLGFSSLETTRFRPHQRPAIVFFAWCPERASSGIHGVVWDPFTKRLIDPGYDHDRCLPERFYLRLWKQSNFKSLVITGRSS